jgi:uncharacterized protein YbjT (DUF2867 family)
MPPPIIAVLGATGSQGGGVVAALQKQGKFGIRAVTRNAQKAKALADQGVEVVEADMKDKESLLQVPAHLHRALLDTPGHMCTSPRPCQALPKCWQQRLLDW